MVHTAVGYARELNRLGALVCTSSIGPGATNMVTGAALATINRLPVLLAPRRHLRDAPARPGAAAARGDPPPATSPSTTASSPVSRYFDRIERPEQSCRGARGDARADEPGRDRRRHARVPAGRAGRGVRLPGRASSRSASGTSARPLPDADALARAAAAISERATPADRRGRRDDLLGGDRGAARASSSATGIPVGETQAGKGSLPYDHPSASARSARPARSRRTGSPPRPTS